MSIFNYFKRSHDRKFDVDSKFIAEHLGLSKPTEGGGAFPAKSSLGADVFKQTLEGNTRLKVKLGDNEIDFGPEQHRNFDSTFSRAADDFRPNFDSPTSLARAGESNFQDEAESISALARRLISGLASDHAAGWMEGACRPGAGGTASVGYDLTNAKEREISIDVSRSKVLERKFSDPNRPDFQECYEITIMHTVRGPMTTYQLKPNTQERQIKNTYGGESVIKSSVSMNLFVDQKRHLKGDAENGQKKGDVDNGSSRAWVEVGSSGKIDVSLQPPPKTIKPSPAKKPVKLKGSSKGAQRAFGQAGALSISQQQRNAGVADWISRVAGQDAAYRDRLNKAFSAEMRARPVIEAQSENNQVVQLYLDVVGADFAAKHAEDETRRKIRMAGVPPSSSPLAYERVAVPPDFLTTTVSVPPEALTDSVATPPMELTATLEVGTVSARQVSARAAKEIVNGLHTMTPDEHGDFGEGRASDLKRSIRGVRLIAQDYHASGMCKQFEYEYLRGRAGSIFFKDARATAPGELAHGDVLLRRDDSERAKQAAFLRGMQALGADKAAVNAISVAACGAQICWTNSLLAGNAEPIRFAFDDPAATTRDMTITKIGERTYELDFDVQMRGKGSAYIGDSSDKSSFGKDSFVDIKAKVTVQVVPSAKPPGGDIPRVEMADGLSVRYKLAIDKA